MALTLRPFLHSSMNVRSGVCSTACGSYGWPQSEGIPTVISRQPWHVVRKTPSQQSSIGNPAEDRVLHELRSQGLSHKAIAAQLPGRTMRSVAGRVHLLKVKANNAATNEKTSEEDKNTEDNTNDVTWENFLDESVLQPATNEPTATGKRGSGYWTTEEQNILLELRSRGMTQKDIAAQLPRRSLRSVIHRLKYLRRKGKECAEEAEAVDASAVDECAEDENPGDAVQSEQARKRRKIDQD